MDGGGTGEKKRDYMAPALCPGVSKFIKGDVQACVTSGPSKSSSEARNLGQAGLYSVNYLLLNKDIFPLVHRSGRLFFQRSFSCLCRREVPYPSSGSDSLYSAHFCPTSPVKVSTFMPKWSIVRPGPQQQNLHGLHEALTTSLPHTNKQPCFPC